MPSLLHWIIAAAIAVLIALALVLFLPGGPETAVRQQTGEMTPSRSQ